jgi:hypothetical protein
MSFSPTIAPFTRFRDTNRWSAKTGRTRALIASSFTMLFTLLMPRTTSSAFCFDASSALRRSAARAG